MVLLNPVYSLILPFLFIFTAPIALLATLTTFLAFSILAFRVVLIYIELALAVIPYYLLGARPASTYFKRSKSFQNQPTISPARRKRRGSTSSSLSATGSLTPVSSETVMGLSQSVGPTRDYEGVGGWRLDKSSDDEDALWTGINSRLELPAEHTRRHHRSLTGGSMPGDTRANRSYSPEATMNTSKARTPPSSMVGLGEGYFPHTAGSPKTLKRISSVSSGSSKGSSILSMKQR
ncbi:hypothetical protein BGZ57DRAFT_329664 [Hyaloscypha finlandica]|jgi:hypothetical protein|nr:hypothetical protein F5882DRAFT_404689 [Hyaloscypha sp. PMI_1271]KAH8794939.1 hypothetical protein BGZ57DRAFT_329664 [Hyaloscypha finlandica]